MVVKLHAFLISMLHRGDCLASAVLTFGTELLVSTGFETEWAPEPV
jgi:hypothetical protein